MPSVSIAALIDKLLAEPKTLGGVPNWGDASNDGEVRLKMPLLREGVSTGAVLVIAAFPNVGHSRFRLMINAPRCLWRVDHVHDEPHVNDFNRPNDMLEMFCEPHYHAWADNRRFCTHNALPDRLRNARILPAANRSFDTVFRWFCGETGIEQPPNGLIALPRRTRLL